MTTGRRAAVATGIVALAAAGLLAAPASAKEVGSGQLNPGDSLTAGQSITSVSGGFQLIMQSDGNLVEYLTTADRPVWWTHTAGAVNTRFVMQTDGNAVLYSGNRPLFATGTASPPGSNRFVELLIEDTGELVVGAADQTRTRWTSHSAVTPDFGNVFERETSPNDRYDFVMQHDGNLVLYSRNGTRYPLWSSGTAGHRDSYAVTQSDGNLVVYSGSTPTFASGTMDAWTSLSVQDDGNAVLYTLIDNFTAIVPDWSTGTAGRN